MVCKDEYVNADDIADGITEQLPRRSDASIITLSTPSIQLEAIEEIRSKENMHPD